MGSSLVKGVSISHRYIAPPDRSKQLDQRQRMRLFRWAAAGIWRYDKRVWIQTRFEDDAVVIEVEDNGVGMDEATRQRLFEPFFTTKDADQGTGLGLSIIYAIVRNHDGEITVESEEGMRTTFRVRLPIAFIPRVTLTMRTLHKIWNLPKTDFGLLQRILFSF